MIKEGTILVSGNGKYTYEVVKHRLAEKYNLLNVETNQLEFIIFDTIEGLEKKIEVGVFKYKVQGVSSDNKACTDKPVFKMVNKDTTDKFHIFTKIPKGEVVRHVTNMLWRNSVGKGYMIDDSDLDSIPFSVEEDFNMCRVEDMVLRLREV